MPKREWDEFDMEAERQSEAISGMRKATSGRPSANGSVGGKHTTRARNRRMMPATGHRMAKLAELGVIY